MRLIVLFLILAFLPHPAFAETPLSYRNTVEGAREDSALKMLVSTGAVLPDLPYLVAKVDLNDDGVDEWIFRQDRESACEANVACNFQIVGLSENKPIVLGNVQGRKIGIAEQKSYGVYRLYVYNKKDNDFVYSQYGWEPQKSSFQPL